MLVYFFLLPVITAGQEDMPVDKKATKETIGLYRNLKKLMNKGFMFGHQDDLAYGVDGNMKMEEVI